MQGDTGLACHCAVAFALIGRVAAFSRHRLVGASGRDLISDASPENARSSRATSVAWLTRLRDGHDARGPGRGHGHGRALEADAAPAQFQQLAHAQSREGGDDEQGGVLVVGSPALVHLHLRDGWPRRIAMRARAGDSRQRRDLLGPVEVKGRPGRACGASGSSAGTCRQCSSRPMRSGLRPPHRRARG